MAKKTKSKTAAPRKTRKAARNFSVWTASDEAKLKKLAGKMPTNKRAKVVLPAPEGPITTASMPG